MNYGMTFPMTGGAALVAGHIFGLDDVIAAAIALVLGSIAFYRYGSRIDRGRTTVLIAAAAIATGLALNVHVAGLSWSAAAAVALVLIAGVLALVSRLQHLRSGRVA
jgi:hypothetical protein